MKKLNKKQIFILVTLGLLLILFIVLFICFFDSNKNRYPSEPIAQNSLGNNSELNIDIGNIENSKDTEYKLFEVSNKIELEKIEKIISELDSSLELVNSKEGEYYYWNNSGSSTYFQYSILTNTLTFSIEKGINWDEAELTGNSFDIFMNEYFDKDWDYELTNTLSFNDTSTIFYAKRKIYEKLLIETGEIYNETDYLMLENGKIVAGRLLLTTFTDTQEYVPIVNLETLKTFINSEAYPKSVYFNPSKTAEILSIEDQYLNEDIINIQNDINNCNASEIDLVYLYKSFEQQYLTPVYKIALDCNVEYNDETYSVPATSFVNAIEPNYISIIE